MFKEGDWVNLIRHDGVVFDTFQYDEDWNGKNGFSLKLWQPKEGEWCWFWNEQYYKEQKVPILCQFESMDNEFFIVKNSEIDTIYFEKCEPFIGKLPSYINKT